MRLLLIPNPAMMEAPESSWFSRLLFRFTLGCASLLVTLVVLAPVVSSMNQPIVTVFATDPVLRRIALASAVGLFATACIFFRRPHNRSSLSARRGQVPIRLPPPPTGMGA
jgi:hypothetical protein